MSFRNSNLKLAIKNLFVPIAQDIVVIEPHLGLGDGLISLGLIRALVGREPKTRFYYACRSSCYHSLAWMFQDLNNVFLFVIESGREARQMADFLNARYVPLGVQNVDIKRFDGYFYQQNQVPFEQRWQSAAVPAGLQSEALFEQLNPNHEPYILVANHESTSTCHDLKIPNLGNKKVIYLHPATNNIFDWTKLALLADEIHAIDSSFVHFLEGLFYQDSSRSFLKPFYFHLARQTQTQFTRLLPWEEVHY